jgi:heme o synthase
VKTPAAAFPAGAPGVLRPGPARRGTPASGSRRSAGAVARGLVALTKPRIIELLLVTTVPTMLLAQRGVPSVRLILVTLAGGTLAAGSANTINCYLDRDIDALMKRTARRPLVVGGHEAIRPGEALAWGIALGAGATALLGLMANWLGGGGGGRGGVV